MLCLTYREELIVLTSAFILFALTIPVIIITSYEDKNNENNNNTHSTIPQIKTNFLHMDYRDRIVVNSVKIIESYNGQHNKSNRISIGNFFNHTRDEFRSKYSSIIPLPKAKATMDEVDTENLWKRFNFQNGTVLTSKNVALPLKVDWRDKGVISPVKAQKNCGACWAYSTLGAIEDTKAIKSGYLNDLSTTQMLECNIDDMNCTGGDTVRLLTWLHTNQISIQNESDYLKLKADDRCLNEKSGIHIVDFSVNDFSDNEHLMMLYIAHHGPLIACVNSINWRYYTNGIIQANCDESLKYQNHAVEIIGYDMTGDIPYYIVKNSWGQVYGNNGYLKIAIGNNLCGIAKRVSAVVVE